MVSFIKWVLKGSIRTFDVCRSLVGDPNRYKHSQLKTSSKINGLKSFSTDPVYEM